MSHYLRLVPTWAASLLISAACLGQAPQAAPPSTASDQDLIKIFFTVDNGHGEPVPNLPKESFQLRDDGKPQNIQKFSSGEDVPLTLGLLLDTSGVMQSALPTEKTMADQFLRRAVRGQDLAFLISFDVTVDLLQDLTSDLHLLHSGLEQAHVNVGLHVMTRSGGALNDAVYLASNEVLRRQVGRKALVILTAGVDQRSKVRLKEAIEAAQKADVVCYIVLFFRSMLGHELNDLAEQTGGRLIAVSSLDKLQQALNQITDDLHNQYSVGYLPEPAGTTGGYRSIEITSKEGFKVHARKGYYAVAR